MLNFLFIYTLYVFFCIEFCKFVFYLLSGSHPSDSPLPVLLQPWSSSLPQTPSYACEAVGWDLNGSWWKSKARPLQVWWESEAHCIHPPPPPYERLVLAPMGPQSGEQWVQQVVVIKSQTTWIIKRFYFTDTHAVNKTNLTQKTFFWS